MSLSLEAVVVLSNESTKRTKARLPKKSKRQKPVCKVVAATEAARESGMELDTRLDNFEQPPTEMEEELMWSPHVEATVNDLDDASREMEVELGNINMSQEPEVFEEEPSVEATCDDPEEAAAEAVVHVGLEIEQEPRPKPTVEATCNGSEVAVAEAAVHVVMEIEANPRPEATEEATRNGSEEATKDAAGKAARLVFAYAAANDMIREEKVFFLIGGGGMAKAYGRRWSRPLLTHAMARCPQTPCMYVVSPLVGR
ncbi:hypothetical protein KFL_003670070 [Klebsormidium nitens]|uniref:Uncharacterized protein n=1 Tax=Klebsormidium nitens TaxID=105231 RepID=A0A1Y1IFV1_KLENI|nr:hypothetical protein KFL_003670070 [Klebsormidium nitens]|eukprot:GAQ87646.1 hypothetical protein KFL_003670070 [Klebsormidium nitens]